MVIDCHGVFVYLLESMSLLYLFMSPLYLSLIYLSLSSLVILVSNSIWRATMWMRPKKTMRHKSVMSVPFKNPICLYYFLLLGAPPLRGSC